MIKHGVKLSAMPAWGVTHSDTLIRDMVAFVHTLPKLTGLGHRFRCHAEQTYDNIVEGDDPYAKLHDICIGHRRRVPFLSN